MRRALRNIGGVLVGVVWALFLLAQFAVWFSPAVREHCLDTVASESTETVVVDSKWVVILWPPPPLAATNPAGRCVRNLPARELADYLGVWQLPSPEEQVQRHVRDQLESQ